MATEQRDTVARSLETIEGLISAAIAAETTRDMAMLASEAQAAAAGLKNYLETELDAGSFSNRDQVLLAHEALSEALTAAEKIALGTDVPSMRERVVGFRQELEVAILGLQDALQL